MGYRPGSSLPGRERRCATPTRTAPSVPTTASARATAAACGSANGARPSSSDTWRWRSPMSEEDIYRPADQTARDRIRGELDATLFVEAGAGTGKTTELGERILRLVATGRARMPQLAALTFTPGAAADARARGGGAADAARRAGRDPVGHRRGGALALVRRRAARRPGAGGGAAPCPP